MYRYLFWDIDGTVLDFLASESYAIKTLFQKHGLGVCTDEMIKIYSQINIKYWQALERNEMTKREVLVGRFREFFAEMGIDTAPAEEFNREYQVTLGDHCVFMKHAEEVLRAQKGKYVLVAVTNGTKTAQEKKLRRSGLDNVVDKVFISEDVGVEKPNAAYFEYIFEQMKITDKSRVLLIGDSLTSDMLGGRNAGIQTCWFNPGHQPNTKGIPVTYEIDDLSELDAILNGKKPELQ